MRKMLILPKRPAYNRKKYAGLCDAARHRAKVHDLQNKISDLSESEKQLTQDRNKAQELYGQLDQKHKKLDKKNQALMRSNETFSKKYNRILTEHEKQNRRLERLEALFQQQDSAQKRISGELRSQLTQEARTRVQEELNALRQQTYNMRDQLTNARQNQGVIDELVAEKARLEERYEEKIEGLKNTLEQMGWEPTPEFKEAILKVKETHPDFSEAQAEATLDIYKRFSTLELD